MKFRVFRQAFKCFLNRSIARYVDDITAIVMYHGICEYYRPSSITLWDFEEGLRELRRMGFQSSSLAELTKHDFRPKGRRVLITFDEAEKGVIKYGLPMLQRHQMQACTFVSAALPNTSYGFSWAETPKSIVGAEEIGRYKGYTIDHMDASDIVVWLREGMEIGSHGLWHLDLSQLSLNPDLLLKEVTQSKDMLERNFGVAIEAFAYPSDPTIRPLRNV